MNCRYLVELPDGTSTVYTDQPGVTHLVVAEGSGGWLPWAGFGERIDAAVEQSAIQDRRDVKAARVVPAHPINESEE